MTCSDIFANETKFWQCSSKAYQGNFASDSKYGWSDLWQFATKINQFKLGNLWLIFAIASKVNDLVVASSWLLLKFLACSKKLKIFLLW